LTDRSFRRPLLLYVALALGIVAAGLLSRKYPGFLFPVFGKYPGDVLWTMLVYVLWRIARPKASSRTIALLALATSYLDELSQLYQAGWIVNVRSTTLGHLILGSQFEWRDCVAYTVGAFLALIMESTLLIIHRKSR
jgi:hypothetical protein